ncbi:MAG: hypothetical protein GC189_10435 [Alphaproteobacteria bacterium]|nr:hypothetical protein [Alphaproteobacteria bacterium]
MRALIATAAGAAALLFSSAASAETVSIAPTVYEPAYLEKLEDDYGVRETEELDRMVTVALQSALTRAGATVDAAAPVRIETTIVDARPNRPTFQQLSDEPSLDFGRSFGVGGAKLHGVIRGADGQVIEEIDYRWYETDIRFAAGTSQWHDARRAIRWYAERVADAVAD